MSRAISAFRPVSIACALALVNTMFGGTTVLLTPFAFVTISLRACPYWIVVFVFLQVHIFIRFLI